VRAILSTAETIQKAEEAIKNKDWGSATFIYRELNKRMPDDERFYDRLMMLYRRQNMLKNELDVIDRGIKTISAIFHAQGDKLFAQNAAVKRISNALLRSLNLKNANGKYLFDPDKVVQWKKRKEIVLKKITAQKVKRNK
jgi:hypothetical protein